VFYDVGILKGYILKFHKKSKDGSGKGNVILSQSNENEVVGVVYDFDPNEKNCSMKQKEKGMVISKYK
jgi:hypothetical protein